MDQHRVTFEEDVRPGMRLGRSVVHDPRSRAYAVEAAPLGALRSVRHHRRVEPYDQKDLGDCTGMACAGALSTAPFTHRFHERTAIRIYSAATRIDPFEGTYPPSDTGSSGLAVAQVAKQNGWVSEYRHAFSFEAALTALQAAPVLLGITWRSAMDRPTPTGQALWSGSVRGGHEIVLDELDVEHQRVWLTNSWSTRWAQSGRAWLSFDDLGAALQDDGDLTVLVP